MKKGKITIYSLFGATLAFTILASSVVAFIGSTDGMEYLKTLPDYNWTTGDYGNNGYNFKYKNVDSIDGNIKLGSQVEADNWSSVIDYKKFGTGYQWAESIKKQAVTGVPTQKIFMPNGNTAAEFGVENKAENFLKLNSILNWDPSTDSDAKYDQGVETLRQTTNTALKNVDTQSSKMNSLFLGFTTNQHRAARNGGVGVNSPYENTYTSFQYTSIYDDWGGSFFEGIVKIPNSETIDAAHKNGTAMYGNIFLDGYHGLTKNMLVDFLKKDNDGNYLIVDQLLKMAEYFKLDGFFWNQEGNGGLPNGTIVDYRDIYNIFVQFNEKKVLNEATKNLKQIFYSSYSNLNLDESLHPMNIESNKMSEVADMVCQDFGQIPYQLHNFTNRYTKYFGDQAFNIFNIIEQAAPSLQGFYDTRMLTSDYYDANGNQLTSFGNDYSEMKSNNNQLKFTTNSGEQTSFTSYSLYQDGGATAYTSTLTDKNEFYQQWINEDNKARTKDKQSDSFIFKQQLQHIADQMTYTGRNRFLRGAAVEADPKYDKKYQDKIGWDDDGSIEGKTTSEKIANAKIAATQTEDYGVTNNGYNAEWGINKNEIMDAFSYDDGIVPQLYSDEEREAWNLNDNQIKWLYAKDENDNYVYSFGAGDVQQENTVINDYEPEFTTNFSTGSGINFAEADGNVIKNMAWSNKRLQDIAPTYASEVLDVTDFQEDNLSDEKLTNFSQNKVGGFYDYYNQYEKGNSFALAKGLNYDGSLKGTDISDKKTLWNIFGTNLSSDAVSNKELTIKFKLTNNTGDSKADIKNSDFDFSGGNTIQAALTLDDGQVVVAPLNISSDRDNWFNGTYTFTDDVLANIGTRKIAKIGLYIAPTNGQVEFKNAILNVGEMSLKENGNSLVVGQEADSLNIQSEYVVARENELNARISWDEQDNVKYYEIFVYDPNAKKSYMVGQTTQNIYYVSQVDKNDGLYIGVRPVYQNNGSVGNIYVQKIIQ